MFDDPYARVIDDPDHLWNEERFIILGMSIEARELIADNLDTDALLRVMTYAGDLADTAAHTAADAACKTADTDAVDGTGGPELVLAVARDEAFCFYYEENLRMLERYGIRLEEFSPMYSRELPENTAGLLLGGGYPELHAEDLSDNERMRELIRSAVAGGMPCMAECGGFMYLLDEIAGEDGAVYPMCGAIRGSSTNTGKLSRFGYVTVSGTADTDTLISGLSIRGHEFHYYDSDNNGSDAVAVKPGSGRSWECMYAGRSLLAGYPHLYYPSCPGLISRFYDAMKQYIAGR